MSQRAATYRRLHSIPESWGTAVNGQAMVFGNLGEDSATGVAFTRNPSTGVKQLYGEFLINAQGEDVVAGIRTPQNLTEAARASAHSDKPSMEAAMPNVFREFVAAAEKLERHYRDMQDMEFTVERGKLYMLQTRGGKRTAQGGVGSAAERANGGLTTREEALTRVDPSALAQLLHPTIDENAPRTIIASGLPASPGAASGEITFSADEAEVLKAAGRKVILVRVETSPEDIHGMHAAEGILTTRGGMTSHAAVVARGMGKPCVSGAGSLRVDYAAKTMSAGAHKLKAGDIITVDGSSRPVLPMPRADFIVIFEIMKALPAIIRLLDPPLHEFLPHTPADISEVAKSMGADPKKLERRAAELEEFNPMPGFRGCRIALAFPAIAEK